MGLCGAHYARSLRGGDMDQPVRFQDPNRICVVEGCGRAYSARGYCSMHYTRFLREGNIDELFRACKVSGCDRAAFVKGFCNLHYVRDRQNLKMDDLAKGHPLRQVVTIDAIHRRLKSLWGPARQYPCIECGKQARDWAYDGTDPTQCLGLKGGTKLWYSQFPEFYMPLCKKCHNSFDGARKAAELREYREWQFATRMTAADMVLVKVGIPQ